DQGSELEGVLAARPAHVVAEGVNILQLLARNRVDGFQRNIGAIGARPAADADVAHGQVSNDGRAGSGVGATTRGVGAAEGDAGRIQNGWGEDVSLGQGAVLGAIVGLRKVSRKVVNRRTGGAGKGIHHRVIHGVAAKE